MSAEQPYRIITVRDENGDELTVYEIWCNRSFFGLVAERRFELCSGEQVVAVDDGSFIVAFTGERLTRVSVPKAAR